MNLVSGFSLICCSFHILVLPFLCVWPIICMHRFSVIMDVESLMVSLQTNNWARPPAENISVDFLLIESLEDGHKLSARTLEMCPLKFSRQTISFTPNSLSCHILRKPFSCSIFNMVALDNLIFTISQQRSKLSM